MITRTGTAVSLLALFVLLVSSPTAGGGEEKPAEFLQGERMYREGILPGGEPMKAVVHGDIPVDGRMFSCSHCHLRSGLGSIEGTIITLPTNGEWLYKPLEGTEIPAYALERVAGYPRKLFRPAYTDEGVAGALRAGVDSGGRKLHGTMPRYFLDDADMKVMLGYLKNLSARPSPGVTDTHMRLATVIAADVDPAVGDAVFAVLQAMVNDRNAKWRSNSRRAKRAPFYKGEHYTSFREIQLERWDLEGPPESWRGQLESHYLRNPVFALLGGISGGSWEPVHSFSEEREIPCLFPITDFPVVSESDWYTLYTSKGWYQEGETAARYLRSLEKAAPGAPVIQVYRGNPEGVVLAQSLRESRLKLRLPPPEEIDLDDAESARAVWNKLARRSDNPILVLWLGPDDLVEYFGTAASFPRRPAVILSSRLLAGKHEVIPTESRDTTFLTYPNSLPGEKKKIRSIVNYWMKARNLEVPDEIMRGQLYLTGNMLTQALMHLKGDFYRDYLLDVMDMMQDQYYDVSIYPRLSYGQGQRYASKGCYIVRLGEGDPPKIVPVTGWVVR
jgi:hypothetical protein